MATVKYAKCKRVRGFTLWIRARYRVNTGTKEVQELRAISSIHLRLHSTGTVEAQKNKMYRFNQNDLKRKANETQPIQIHSRSAVLLVSERNGICAS
jgi:hypothetical protein